MHCYEVPRRNWIKTSRKWPVKRSRIRRTEAWPPAGQLILLSGHWGHKFGDPWSNSLIVDYMLDSLELSGRLSDLSKGPSIGVYFPSKSFSLTLCKLFTVLLRLKLLSDCVSLYNNSHRNHSIFVRVALLFCSSLAGAHI